MGQLQALPEHGSLLFCQTRTQTEPQPLAGPVRSESDHDNDTQALLGIECVDSHEEEHDDTKIQRTRAAPLPWLPLLLVGLLFILYAALLQEAATRFELWFYEHGTLTGPEDWRLVARAGRKLPPSHLGLPTLQLGLLFRKYGASRCAGVLFVSPVSRCPGVTAF